jgi:L-rhamnose-H+ transport protein
MMGDTTVGLLLLLVAGVTNASFTLPMKYTRRWAWENTWLAWTVFALLVLPPAVTFATIPQIGRLYGDADSSLLLTVAAFGVGWGVAQVFFGLAVNSIGIALTFSIVLGISAALGSIIPLLRLHPDKIFTSGGLGVLLGVALVIVGVIVCAAAGRRREAALGASPATQGGSSMGRGLLLAIGSGLGAAMVNLGLAFGGPLLESAHNLGAAPVWAPNAVWLPLMLAGAIPNLVYCVYLLSRNRTAGSYGEEGTGAYWLYAFIMALFWFGSTSLYGISTGKLGSWGTILGWPLFMSLIVITASVLGVLTGEWKNAGKRPLRQQMGGVVVLVLAVFVLSAASRWV